MKIRTDFVTNSSSSSFIITNNYNKERTLADFIQDNWVEIDMGMREYGRSMPYSIYELIKSAKEDYPIVVFSANSSRPVEFGDEHGTVLGHVFDYVLRNLTPRNDWEVKLTECRGVTY